jgi:hypothetical protein
MKSWEQSVDRRSFLTAAGLVFAAPAVMGAEAEGYNPDEGVTAAEDLMKEHGVLNRCLLIYEEDLRRIQSKQEISPDVFPHTAELVRKFVEEYHEQNEEKYIFLNSRKPGR